MRYCTLPDCRDHVHCKHRHTDGSCVYEYNPDDCAPEMRWKGEGPPPRRWWANGTLVYRSFADYCD